MYSLKRRFTVVTKIYILNFYKYLANNATIAVCAFYIDNIFEYT